MLNALPQNIIFTEESSVEDNLKYVMGGIGPRGFRTPLVRFDKHVNSKTYIEALLQYNIAGIIRSIFRNSWRWQDNEPAHKAFNSRYVFT